VLTRSAGCCFGLLLVLVLLLLLGIWREWQRWRAAALTQSRAGARSPAARCGNLTYLLKF
jgi:hypothetical protein